MKTLLVAWVIEIDDERQYVSSTVVEVDESYDMLKDAEKKFAKLIDDVYCATDWDERRKLAYLGANWEENCKVLSITRLN